MKYRLVTSLGSAAATFVLIASARSAPMPLIQIDFNDASGNQSVANHGTVAVTPVLTGDTAGYSNDVPPVHSGGWSGTFNGPGSEGNLGNDKVDLGDVNEVDLASKLTLSAWINGIAFHTNGSRLIAKSNSNGSGWEFSVLQGQSGGPDGYPAFGGANSILSANAVIPQLGGRIPIGQWRFVAVTYDGTSTADNLTWYVGDGTTLNSATVTFNVGQLGGNAEPLLIGNYRFGGRAFQGQIDSARVYTETLTQSEIFDVMTFDDPAGLAPPAVPGDFDGDGDVDGADFVAWQTNFPKATGATLAEGDADGDGDVDGADFVVWQTNFPFTPSPGVTSIPEPRAFILAVLSGLTIALWRGRSHFSRE